jgi:hypothetical protein
MSPSRFRLPVPFPFFSRPLYRFRFSALSRRSLGRSLAAPSALPWRSVRHSLGREGGWESGRTGEREKGGLENGRTGERETGRTGERENGRTGERENGTTGERENGRTGERETGRTGNGRTGERDGAIAAGWREKVVAGGPPPPFQPPRAGCDEIVRSGVLDWVRSFCADHGSVGWTTGDGEAFKRAGCVS